MASTLLPTKNKRYPHRFEPVFYLLAIGITLESRRSSRKDHKETNMKRYFAPALFIGLVCAGLITTQAFAQANNANAQSHLAAARALAYEPGHDYTGSFEVICAQPQPAGARGNGGRGGGG